MRKCVANWIIRANAFMGRVLFQNKIKVSFTDTEKQEALMSYLKYDLDGTVSDMRKGIDGFITFVLDVRNYGIPYEIRVLETKDKLTYGAHLAAGSPRVYVRYGDGKKLTTICISIDENNPKVLNGDEKMCAGADLSSVYEFIRRCYIPLMKHWEGIINSLELSDEIDFIMMG